MKAIIVEDEITSQEYLKDLVQHYYPAITIVAVADNVSLATEVISQLKPDLVFMDIDIKMGTGFDVLAALPNISSEIIFTTAFNQFAVDAFKYHAVDYLLKPLQDKQVLDAIDHCISRIELKNQGQQVVRLMKFLQQPAQQKQRINIHTVEGIEFVDADDILFAEAKGNYTELKLNTGIKLTTSRKLKEMEQTLGTGFFRIHHSYLVNTRYIKKYFKGRGGYVILMDGNSLPVSVARKDDFLKHFGEI